jgi:hypothetical protein
LFTQFFTHYLNRYNADPDCILDTEDNPLPEEISSDFDTSPTCISPETAG